MNEHYWPVFRQVAGVLLGKGNNGCGIQKQGEFKNGGENLGQHVST